MADSRPGAPCWADLASRDLDASTRYYCDLFGWEARRSDDPAAAGYRMFFKDASAVPGAGRLTHEDRPPAWTTYVRVEDAAAASAAFQQAGGGELLPATEVRDWGRRAIVADPGGAVLGLWEAGAFAGAQARNEPGSLCWNELATRDPDAAGAFYGRTLGWRGVTNEAGYSLFLLDGQPVAGMVRMDEEWPPEMPAHWMVYFAAEDVDDAAARASELGGTVMVPPTDTGVGPFTVVRDPQGAAFSVIRPAPPPGQER